MTERLSIVVPAGEHECFNFIFVDGATAAWDVTLAQAFVAMGHTIALSEIGREAMQAIADRNSWDPAKLDRVDPAQPGISVPIVHEGQVIYQLIDGMHRNARALRDGLPFSAYLLTDEASRACLIYGPAERMPWSAT